MADDSKSLKDWKTYYKNRYDKTGKRVYLNKFKKLSEEIGNIYLFDYDKNYIQSRNVLMRANQIINRWAKIEANGFISSREKVLEILNEHRIPSKVGFNNMNVTSANLTYKQGSELHSEVDIYFEDEFNLIRYCDGSWELRDMSIDY